MKATDVVKTRLLTCCWTLQGDLPFLKEAMAAENPIIQRAAIFPSFEQIAMLAHQDPSLSLAKAIELYAER